MRKAKRVAFWAVIVSYIAIIAGYLLGKVIAGNAGLEYRFWAETIFRIIVWFVPVLLIGAMILLACIKQWKKKSGIRWILVIVLAIILVFYVLVAAYLSFGYILINVFTMTTDEKMADGNLVVAVPEGMEYYHHYAEPVGFVFRRDITFDDQRLADSLSKVYGVSFQVENSDGEDTEFISDVYPGIEVKIIRHGYTESNYLENDLKFALTSQRLEKHRKIYEENGVELVPYVFGRTEEKPEGHGTYFAVLITEDNQEGAAKAIAEFIRATLQEDLRADGESCWNSVDGSVFLTMRNEETGEIESLRNIPFSLNPEHYWVFDETVTSEEILEKIKQVLD